MYALSTGWTYTDKNPWGSHFNYDDPRFQQTMAWFHGLIDKGYVPSLATARSGTSVVDGFGAGKYALSTNGSWMINSYFGYDGPFPPFNDSLIHHYVFTLYALKVDRLALSGTFNGTDARRAVRDHVIAEATHSGTYTLNRRLLG